MLTVACPKCETPLPESQFNAPDFQPCGSCSAPVRSLVFPACFERAPGPVRAEDAVLDDEARCFYLPEKKAVAVCDSCGVFLSSLYVFELDGKNLCPKCVEKGKAKGDLKSLEHTRVCYDSVALSLSLLPIIMWPFTLVTAPMALYIAVRNWKKPCSIIPRSKVRFVFAIFFALIQIVGWAFLGLGIYLDLTS